MVRNVMVEVRQEHFHQAALEIGQNGENDTLPYDRDAAFVRDKADDLSGICFTIFSQICRMSKKNTADFVNSLTIGSERLLVPSGSYGFRITTRIHPFWNLYLNGLGLSVAQANEPKRSHRAHSYRLGTDAPTFFDKARSWRAYKEATLTELAVCDPNSVVVQTDISSYYEHIYHHRLENLIVDLGGEAPTVAIQIDRLLSKIAAGRSFGLPVGGQCARILAEVMLSPTDTTLTDAQIKWHRYVDDFTLICSSQEDAYRALSVLSHSLADYGLSLNRSKTTILSSKHYKDFTAAQLGSGDDASIALRELDLHFDPYSDSARVEYEKLKKSFESIDIQILLDLEKDKSQPDTFVIAQVGRALKYQEPLVASQLCSTLLDPRNLNAFRASWSKIMRGIYSVRANEEFTEIHGRIDDLLDSLLSEAAHLLLPEANILHFMRGIRFRRTDARGAFVRQTYKTSSSQAVKRACIDCWEHWHDRGSFTSLRNRWQNLGPDEQRALWLASRAFGDDGEHARGQLRKSLSQAWALGFETVDYLSFASCFADWAENAA